MAFRPPGTHPTLLRSRPRLLRRPDMASLPGTLEELELQPQVAEHEDRLVLIGTQAEVRLGDFSEDVRAGLSASPKRLSCAFLYDETGSEIFEEICELPEYYLTRAESEILRDQAEEILDEAPDDLTLVELGSGSSTKTRIVIDAYLRRHKRLHYVPIDISREMLEQSSAELLGDFPGLRVTALATEYASGLHALSEVAPGPKLVLWLGSNVGNFERPDAARFLSEVRRDLTPADRLLMGIDLRKDRGTLERAYDDSQGVTARFTLNLLQRINSELGGNFDLDAFRHRATYNEATGRVEIYIDSLRKQTVRIDELDLDVSFEEGESMHAENSHKYGLREIDLLAEQAGFVVNGRWFDRAERYSMNRLVPLEGR